jgi:hypothetical protein
MKTYLFSYSYPNGFGNTYVRTEDPLSQDLIKYIERTAGEELGVAVVVINVVELAE